MVRLYNEECMKQNALCVLLPLVLLTSCGRQNQSSSGPEAEVRVAWAEFKDASLSGNGDVAANRVTRATHEYYDEIRRLALRANRKDLQTFVFAKRYTVLGMRLRVPKAQLNTMSGRDLFVHSIDRGWIGKNSATDVGIGAVTVTGDHARAVATEAGRPTGQYLHFIKEGGVWRLDMMQLMTVVNVAFDQMLRESGMSEDEFTKESLEATTGMMVTEALWTPPEAEPEN